MMLAQCVWLLFAPHVDELYSSRSLLFFALEDGSIFESYFEFLILRGSIMSATRDLPESILRGSEKLKR
jgi:hypothetical protein